MDDDMRVDLAIPIVCLIAFTYTTPWDNYLVAQEVWWYGANRVVGTIGYVPVEEYMFFVLQPILTGLFLYQYLYRVSQPRTHTRRRRLGAEQHCLPESPGWGRFC
jgi:lycopene cyclase domain